MKKLRNTEAELKKSVVYKKKHVLALTNNLRMVKQQKTGILFLNKWLWLKYTIPILKEKLSITRVKWIYLHCYLGNAIADLCDTYYIKGEYT